MSEQLDTFVRELEQPSRYLSRLEYRALAEQAIDELLRVVMERPDSVPTYAEARLLFWLEKSKSQGYAPERVGAQDDDDRLVGEHYPKDPYRAPTFTATVHLPDGTTENWKPARLRAAGLLHEGGKGHHLPWDAHYGAELHIDPAGKGYTVHNPATFRQSAYQQWSDHH